MPKIESTTLDGASGQSYPVNVYDGDMRFNDFIPGVYYVSRHFVSADGTIEEEAIYVGESDNVDLALQSHDKRTCFEEHNYNRISLYRMGNEEKRKAAQDDLIKALSPVCND